MWFGTARVLVLGRVVLGDAVNRAAGKLPSAS